MINPWAQVSYNHQFGDSDSAVTAGLKSTRTAFTRSSDASDDNWIDMAVGASCCNVARRYHFQIATDDVHLAFHYAKQIG